MYLNVLDLVDPPPETNAEHRMPTERWVISRGRTSTHPHSLTRFLLPVFIPICYDHD